jgi:hypothetical protein
MNIMNIYALPTKDLTKTNVPFAIKASIYHQNAISPAEANHQVDHKNKIRII